MEFSRIITLLRKERGITQKQAAQDLGVSQALLSHYEKGIRECGLDFVVRVADYYGVSRQPSPQGTTPASSNISQSSAVPVAGALKESPADVLKDE